MIEVKNISKTYRPKKGVPVKALDDVSLKFDDTGMVFILGKSGSGKSTLLNVLGGLDSYDSGEFVIQGKSSKDFSQADFDSYRNTLIGFIFQEYNILNDFSVGANIALAMQLQGKKATNEALNDILDQVDLTGYANRKPNELSGGQKQRVAIARALIKEPRIIMADEPTGALDSNTGKQVFDTLKKLSETKLVIIVSHDREFAEFYGDRVIELADGKIISDISKYLAPGVEKSEGVKVIDDRILHIKQGYKLTAKDLELINSYLENSTVDTLISLDKRSNDSFKQIAMIDDSGNKQSFADTSTMQTMTAEEYEGERLKLIKSRMPYMNSLKMGASSLKHKKIRLVFTIFLSVVAFALFGLADTFATYDKNTAAVNSIIDGNVTSMVVEKNTKQNSGDYTYYNSARANDADIAKIKEKTGVSTKGVVRFKYSIGDYLKVTGQPPAYYNGVIAGATAFTDADIKEYGFTVKGKLPTANNEIAITKWHFEHFAEYGYRNYNTNEKYEASELKDMDTFLNKNLTIDYSFGGSGKNDALTIVGIIDTGLNKNGEYDDLKQSSNGNMNSWQFQNAISKSMDSLMFVSQGYLDNLISGDGNVLGRELHGDRYSHNIKDLSGTLSSFSRIAKLSELSGKYAFSSSVSSLKDNQVLISSNYLMNKLYDIPETISQMPLPENYRTIQGIGYEGHDSESGSSRVYKVIENSEATNVSEFMALYGNSYLRTHFLLQEDFKITDEMKQSLQDYGANIDMNDPEQVKLAVIDRFQYDITLIPSDLYDKVNLKITKHIADLMIEMNLLSYFDVELVSEYYQDYSPENMVTRDLEIVGFFIDTGYDNYYTVVSSDNLYDSTMGSGEAGVYEFLIGKMPTDKDSIAKIVAFGYEEGDTVFRLRNSVTDALDNFNEMIEVMAEIFIYVGIGFAVFAALMMMNFISTSISYKKREIGILRAVGARGSDVFGIFFNESAIIALINFVLAALGTMGACIGLNSVIRNELGFPITILSLGIRQVALIFAVSLLAAFVASLLPVMKIARKRPIDAIQNR